MYLVLFVNRTIPGTVLKWAAEEINPKIRGPLEVNTKLFLIRYMLIFLTKYVPLTSFTCLIGEKLVNILHKKW